MVRNDNKPWPPPEPDVLGFLGTSMGGGCLLLFALALPGMATKSDSTALTALLATATLAVTVFVVYCVSRLFKLPRRTYLVGLLAIVPCVLAVRSVHRRAERDAAYAALWQVCWDRPQPDAAPLERSSRRAAMFQARGARWEPREKWVPIDLASTALVGCTRTCGTEIRVATTARSLGCASSPDDLALLIEPVER